MLLLSVSVFLSKCIFNIFFMSSRNWVYIKSSVVIPLNAASYTSPWQPTVTVATAQILVPASSETSSVPVAKLPSYTHIWRGQLNTYMQVFFEVFSTELPWLCNIQRYSRNQIASVILFRLSCWPPQELLKSSTTDRAYLRSTLATRDTHV